jgi:hypothetical protein
MVDNYKEYVFPDINSTHLFSKRVKAVMWLIIETNSIDKISETLYDYLFVDKLFYRETNFPEWVDKELRGLGLKYVVNDAGKPSFILPINEH